VEKLKNLNLHFGIHVPGVGEIKVDPTKPSETKARLYADFEKAIEEAWDELQNSYNGILLVVDELHNLETFDGVGSFFKVVSEAWAVDGYRNAMFAAIGLPDVPVKITEDDPSAPRVFSYVELKRMTSTECLDIVNSGIAKSGKSIESDAASDNFTRPNENPLASPPWNASFQTHALQIVSDLCEETTTSGTSGESYTGIALPADQYASATIGSITTVHTVFLSLFVRVTGNSSSGNYYELSISKSGAGNNFGLYNVVGGTPTQILSTLNPSVSAGDVWTLAVVGTTLFVIQNGIQLGSVTDATIASGPAAALRIQAGFNLTDVQISNFAVGSAALQPYSVPDCRQSPNASRNVNGTLIYDVQTSSNPAIPPTDSRGAGAPVACGEYPQNSRTPGTYGPGE
jgi:hypothetical protein